MLILSPVGEVMGWARKVSLLVLGCATLGRCDLGEVLVPLGLSSPLPFPSQAHSIKMSPSKCQPALVSADLLEGVSRTKVSVDAVDSEVVIDSFTSLCCHPL